MPEVLVCHLFTKNDDQIEQTPFLELCYQVIDDERRAMEEELASEVTPLMPLSMYNLELTFFENWQDFCALAENDVTLMELSRNFPKEELIYQSFSIETFENGCQHYLRNCKVKCSVCDKFYWCKNCHDESESHLFVSALMICCAFCQKVEAASNRCEQCDKLFSKYFCSECTLYDDLSPQSKPIFHCDKCGICRVGKRSLYRHCDRCCNCIQNHKFEGHNCKNDDICPICLGPLVMSQYPRFDMPCGHQIHMHCYQEIRSDGERKCPLCRKSLLTPEQKATFIEEYTSLIKTVRVPWVLRNRYALIACSDCGGRSVRKMRHFRYLCTECGGYNTDVVQQVAKGAYQKYSAEHPGFADELEYSCGCAFWPANLAVCVSVLVFAIIWWFCIG